MPRILIVDDDMFIQAVITTLLTKHGYDVTAASSGEGALHILRNQMFDLMISDVNMMPMDGLTLLRKVRESYVGMDVIMLTSQDSIAVAVETMKKGAFDFLVKPFRPDELFLTVQRSLGSCNVAPANQPTRPQLEPVDGLVAESVSMRKVCDIIKRIALANVTVLLCGEKGSDKEVVARTLHYYSPRKCNPFAALDCAALPAPQIESKLFGCVNGAPADQKGLFEAAHKGTLFLDNINALPLETQPKLLDIIQNKKIYKVGGTRQIEIDVRLVVASSEKLDILVEQGAFQEDLYFRLSALRIDIPPLRNRREDIPVLVNQALRRDLNPVAETPALDPKTREILYNYTWPGDIRELEDAVKHALSLSQVGEYSVGGMITKEMLPEKIVAAFEEGVRSGNITGHEQFKGRAFKAFLQAKKEELLDQVNKPPDEEDKVAPYEW